MQASDLPGSLRLVAKSVHCAEAIDEKIFSARYYAHAFALLGCTVHDRRGARRPAPRCVPFSPMEQHADQ